MARGGWALLKKLTLRDGKKHMARFIASEFVNLVTSYVRPIKAVG